MASPVRPIFPFTALVGQERMKLGLLLNAGFNALRARLLAGFPEEG